MINRQCAGIVRSWGSFSWRFQSEMTRCPHTGKRQQKEPFCISGDGFVWWRGVDGHATMLVSYDLKGACREAFPISSQVAVTVSAVNLASSRYLGTTDINLCRHHTKSSCRRPATQDVAGSYVTCLPGHRLTARRNCAHDDPGGWLHLNARASALADIQISEPRFYFLFGKWAGFGELSLMEAMKCCR